MWEQALQALADKVKGFASEAGLGFEQFVIAEYMEPGEPYVEMTTSPEEVEKFILEPAEFAGTAMPAVVWLYDYPTMRRVRLVGPGSDGEWAVQSSDGVPFHQNLDNAVFSRLVQDLSLRAA